MEPGSSSSRALAPASDYTCYMKVNHDKQPSKKQNDITSPSKVSHKLRNPPEASQQLWLTPHLSPDDQWIWSMLVLICSLGYTFLVKQTCFLWQTLKQSRERQNGAVTSDVRPQLLVVLFEQVVEDLRGVRVLGLRSQHLVDGDVLVLFLVLDGGGAAGGEEGKRVQVRMRKRRVVTGKQAESEN